MARRMKQVSPFKLLRRFLKSVSTDFIKGEPIYGAVDPGSEGAIGFVCGRHYVVIDIPTMKVKRGKGKKTAFVLPVILRLFSLLTSYSQRLNNFKFLIEKPPPSMGPGKGSAYGQFVLGVAYAMWPLFLMSKGFEVCEVAPGVWKKRMKIGSDKETSRHKALGLFPKAPLARKKDHNRAEALLLAKFHQINKGVS